MKLLVMRLKRVGMTAIKSDFAEVYRKKLAVGRSYPSTPFLAFVDRYLVGLR